MRSARKIVLAFVLLAPFALRPASADEIVKTYIQIPIDGQSVRACVQHTGTLTADVPRDVILEWTAYSVETGYSYQPAGGCSPQFQSLVARMAPNGYVHIAANPPGMGRSTGSGFRYWANGDAGAQVIDWIARQPWSTGKVGMIGCSGSAMDGLPVVVRNPPALRASVMGCFAIDAYRGAFYPGGIRHFTNFVNAARITHDVDIEKGQPFEELGNAQTFSANRLLNVADTTRLAYTTTTDDLYWQEKSTARLLADPALKARRAPLLAFGSWQDFFSGAPEFAMLARNATDRVIVHPGWHGSGLTTTGSFGVLDRAVAWFEHHLRGASLPYAAERPIVYWEQDGGFTPGAEDGPITDRFLQTDQWPPQAVTWQRMYLSGERAGASTSINDGSLTLTAPAADGSADAYPYPAPALGSTSDPRGFALASAFTSEIEDAGGALTYTSAPLAHPLHLAGPIALTLWATSTASDTDWIARLIDVAPDGSFKDVTNGYLKASHRELDANKTLRNADGDIIRPYHTHRSPRLITPLEPVEYQVELWQTATEIAAGHRLKLWISSQEVPWFTQANPPAVNTILHDAAHPSSILLPVVAAADLEPAL